MEEKGIDKNAIIGFVLIFAIMIGWFYINQPTPEEIEAQRALAAQSDTEEVIAETEPALTPIVESTTAELPVSNERSYEPVSLETEYFNLEFSRVGGQLKHITLKDFTNHQEQPIEIIQPEFSDLNLKLVTAQGLNLNTNELYFEPEVTQEDDRTRVTLRSEVVEGAFLEFKYQILNNSYLVDFDINTTQLSAYLSSQPAILSWNYTAPRNDQSIQYENRYTRLTYRLGDGSIKKLSATSELDEEEESDLSWISFRHHFFSAILGSKSKFSKAELVSENLVEEESKTASHTKRYQASVELESLSRGATESMYFYFGPTDSKTFANYSEYELIESIPFGWGIFGTINRYIFNPFFNFLAGFMPFGIAIIVMTFVVRIALSPVTYKSYVSQAKMKVIQPEVKEINEKFANNAMKKQQETMKLYNLAGVNPMSGCVPALLQLPIFYALFSFFPTSFILRQKSFLWVDDLSSYDTIVDLPFTIPFYGDHISLFPILASVAIFFYMQMTTGQTMQMQQQPGMPNMKFIMYLSPVMMLFFFNNYASGLSLYYFISNLLTIVIMLVIKNYIIDENRIHLQVQANKQKPAKESKFQRRMREMMEQAEQQKKLK
ncbi:MAG: membrane protein insertase YidC [Bacteroidetes bacterium]|nr:MAG: membrane protein insertase YidC [Bacteroidota bacterium]